MLHSTKLINLGDFGDEKIALFIAHGGSLFFAHARKLFKCDFFEHGVVILVIHVANYPIQTVEKYCNNYYTFFKISMNKI